MQNASTPITQFAASFAVMVAILADSGAAEGDVVFRHQVEPILRECCYECHSHAAKIKGGLVLDSRSGWRTGGDSGPALVPGAVEQSRLIEAVRYGNPDMEMPPKAKPPAAEIAILEEWVTRGAPDPREQSAETAPKPRVDVEAGRRHWAYQPREPAPPTIRDSSWPVNKIDVFILAKLEAAGIRPSPEADAHTWLPGNGRTRWISSKPPAPPGRHTCGRNWPAPSLAPTSFFSASDRS